MAQLKNHPGFWLRDDAAAAFDRAEAAHGNFKLNSAGRTVATQNALIARWNKGGPQNRPPFLYKPAMPAESSNHVANGGIAVDLSDWKRFATIAALYGFSHPYPSGDPVHFEFVGVAQPTPTRPVTTTGRPVLKKGSKGSWVTELQSRLNRNYPAYSKLKVDGDFGAATDKVVREFQRRAKLVVDGIVGDATWNRLGR